MQHQEGLLLFERHELRSAGLGWVDAHLIGAALLDDADLWTLDKRLR